MPYGEEWKERRKLFTRYFHPSNPKVYQLRELEYTHKIVRRLLDSPEKFMEHLRLWVLGGRAIPTLFFLICHCSLAGATALALAYGLQIQKNDDPYIQIAEKALTGIAASGAPGAFLVDSIPLLKYIPSWVPGAAFKRKAKEWKSYAADMMNVPFEAAEKAIVRIWMDFYLFH